VHTDDRPFTLSGKPGILFALLQRNGHLYRFGRGASSGGDWPDVHRGRIFGSDAAELTLAHFGASLLVLQSYSRQTCAVLPNRLGELPMAASAKRSCRWVFGGVWPAICRGHG